MKKTE